MSTELATTAPTVTTEQLELIKRTVATGATADELKLYLYDCARQGVHPLDKLLHFTKRGGRYTPVTSIDLMRVRAAGSGEMAGSDDAAFTDDGHGLAASVSVYRMTQGQRFAYTATARWSEYCPPSGQDHMWQKMPHTMLAKCAEALALRKAFPRQLAGLYASEEMEQAGLETNGSGVTVEAPASLASADDDGVIPRVGRAGEESATASVDTTTGEELPTGSVLITRVSSGGGKVKGSIAHSGQRGGDDTLPIYDERTVILAEQCCQDRVPVFVELKTAASGRAYVKAIRRAVREENLEQHSEPVDSDSIPF